MSLVYKRTCNVIRVTTQEEKKNRRTGHLDREAKSLTGNIVICVEKLHDSSRYQVEPEPSTVHHHPKVIKKEEKKKDFL